MTFNVFRKTFSTAGERLLINNRKLILISYITGLYLPKNSWSPAQYKCAAIRSLIFRAYKLCSSIQIFEKSYKIILAIFIHNGFHYKFVDRIKTAVIANILNKKKSNDIKKIYWKLPYKRCTEKETTNVRRFLNKQLEDKCEVRVAYTTLKSQTFGQNFGGCKE